MSTPLVSLRDVHKRYLLDDVPLDVLKGVDLEVDAGEMVCVMGPSGAGKSTLLNLLGTLDLPTRGQILYEGVDVTAFSPRELARFRNEKLGFVFQFHHLMPEFDAVENVMMPGLVRGVPRRKLEPRARALLEEVGLGARLDHRPGELSGGEQQRVALARALSMEPKLILADEPTGNLDSATSDAVHSLLFQINETRGTTFLVVTHNRELAAKMPRVVTMRDGRVERDERRDLPTAVQGQDGARPISPDDGPAEPLAEPSDEPRDGPAPEALEPGADA
ncbi:MAG: ABC transporter ATP-binding protein [Deltaproteobacteria bacterium]|nr:ABC transporter ATP-binding protein [Deltaproteobacteria bacterium]